MRQPKIFLNGEEQPRLSVKLENILFENDKISFEVNARKYLNILSWEEMGCPATYAAGQLVFDKPYTAVIKKKKLYINGHCIEKSWGPY